MSGDVPSSEIAANWHILAVVILGLAAGVTSTLANSLGAFMPILEESLNWSRADISLGMTAMGLALFLGGPACGWLADRFGVAPVATTSLLLYGALLLISPLLFSRPIALVGTYFLAGLLGGGASPTALMKPVIRSFRQARGTALAIAFAGLGFSAFWVPLFVTAVSRAWGWAAGYQAIGLFALAAAPVVGYCLGRTSRPGIVSDTLVEKHYGNGLAVPAALRSKAFWLLSGITFIVALGLVGTVVHLIPLLIDRGASPGNAAFIASMLGIASITGRLGVGFALDRIGGRTATCAALGCAAVGTLMLAQSGHIYVAVILLGLGFGAEIDLVAYLTSRYLGTKSYGTLYGWLYGLFALGAAVAPLLAGLSVDASGSYQRFLVASCCALAIAVCLTPLLGKYRY